MPSSYYSIFHAELYCLQKLSLDDSRASGMKSISERSIASPVSTQSPATYENSNVVIYEARQSAYMYRTLSRTKLGGLLVILTHFSISFPGWLGVAKEAS